MVEVDSFMRMEHRAVNNQESSFSSRFETRTLHLDTQLNHLGLVEISQKSTNSEVFARDPAKFIDRALNLDTEERQQPAINGSNLSGHQYGLSLSRLDTTHSHSKNTSNRLTTSSQHVSNDDGTTKGPSSWDMSPAMERYLLTSERHELLGVQLSDSRQLRYLTLMEWPHCPQYQR